MESTLAIAGLVALVAITPGPNNVAVVREVARAGWRGALRAGVGIVCGGLMLIVLVASGFGALFESVPGLAVVMTAVCCVVLLGSGAGLLKRSFESTPSQTPPRWSRYPAGSIGLCAFQFINPKAWSLAITVTSAAGATWGLPAFVLRLAVLFTVVSALCLIFWAALGFLLAGWLSRVSTRKWVDRFTAMSFMGFALILVTAVL